MPTLPQRVALHSNQASHRTQSTKALPYAVHTQPCHRECLSSSRETNTTSLEKQPQRNPTTHIVPRQGEGPSQHLSLDLINIESYLQHTTLIRWHARIKRDFETQPHKTVRTAYACQAASARLSDAMSTQRTHKEAACLSVANCASAYTKYRKHIWIYIWVHVYARKCFGTRVRLDEPEYNK